MDWIVASLVSAFFLGWYELSTKHAVRDNAVLPVLFFTNVCSAAVWIGVMAFSAAVPHAPASLAVPSLTAVQHLQLLLKSAIVAASWCCSYFAVKHLPVTLASPIRATGPVWTLLGALVVLAERPSWIEMLGVVITLAAFFGLSAAGAREGIHFRRNRWIWLLVGGTLLNACSALYDKYLLGQQGFSAATVQAWFSIYLAVLFLPLAVGWKLRLWTRHEFHWRWSIVFMSLTLLAADFVYFSALRDPDALISLVSSFRRGSTLVAFAGGVLLFGELNWLQKLPAVLGVLIGIALTIVG
ncbi:MAG TPA: EamA family transporter [Opitutus sp.]|nr:EamA family transporter [Opitutus sp.]